MAKNIVISCLILLVVILSVRLVALENYHYASLVGMCSQYRVDDPVQANKRHECLHATETRTSPLWHLFYALSGE